jgi:hypothetical protein
MNIIQIGCNDGNDHVLSFVKQNIEQVHNLILIDANPNIIPYCQKTYKFVENSHINLNIINCAVVSDSSATPFLDLYLPENHLVSLHCSYSDEHMKQHNHTSTILIQVPTITIENLVNQYQLTKIDYIFIDTEGMDIGIVRDLPFHKLPIDYIKFEHIHSDSPFSKGGPLYDETIQKLESLNYSINKEDNDTIAIRNKQSV